MFSPSNVDNMMMLRMCYKNPPLESHILEKLKLANCHLMMRYRRHLFRTYFNRMKRRIEGTTEIENKDYIGIVSSYNPYGGFGTLVSGNKEYNFVSNDICETYFRHFMKPGDPVLFWGIQSRARNITTLFGEKYKKIRKQILYGEILDGYIFFNVYNSLYSLKLPKKVMTKFSKKTLKFKLISKNMYLHIQAHSS